MMVKTEIGRLKICGYLSLLFMIALGLAAIFATGCSDDGGEAGVSPGDGDGQNGQTPFIEVLINQIDTTDCPRIKAYVSVTDQDGNVVEGLTEGEFSVFEDGVEQLEILEFYVDWPATQWSPISVCLALDYSGSMAEAIDAMEQAAIAFVDKMNDDDEGEIIKFATYVEVVQAFTADKQALIDAITDTWPGFGGDTAFYDAIYQAIEDTASSSRKDRRAIIAMTDGRDNESDHELSELIELAVNSGVPVFTIRLGWALPEEIEDLQEIAEESGGKYFNAPEPEDLEEIYLQISEMLVLQQYIVSYDSDLTDGVTHDLQITVNYQELSDSDSRQFTACTASP